MPHLFISVGILHRKLKRRRVNALHINTPAFRRFPQRFLKRDKLGEVIVVERVRFAKASARIQLVEPDSASRSPFLEEEHDGLDARTLKRAAGTVEHGVEIAAFQEQFAEAHRGIVGIREKRILDYDAAPPTGLEDFDEVLQEKERGLAGSD